MENLLLASQPQVPAPGKWTKLGSILSFLVLGFNCCHCIGPIFKSSLDAFQYQGKKQDPQQDDDFEAQEIDPAITSNLFWSAAHGKRSKSGLTLTTDGRVQFHVLALAMMQEVTRFLTHWLRSRQPAKQAIIETTTFA